MDTMYRASVPARTTAPTRTRRYGTRIIVVAGVIVVALLLSACGRQVPAYWPDLTVDASNGILYIAEANGQVFALRSVTGDTLWSYPVVEQRSGGLLGGCNPQGASDGPFHAAPAFGDGWVFLGSAGEQQRTLFSQGENRSGLRVLNDAGILQWTYKGTGDRTVTPPAVSGDAIYLSSSDHNVYAIDLETRSERWVFSTANWVWATPLVVEDRVYIASMDHVLYAVQAGTGQEIWRFDRAPSALPAMPAYADGVLYVGALNGQLYAVEAKTGNLRWEQRLDGGVWATPQLHGDLLYVGTLRGMLYALNVADGSQVWEQSMEGEVRGTPAYVGGTVYVGCEDGQLYAFDAASGAQQASPLGSPLERASFYTAPVFDGQRLYIVATDGQVFALDPETNQIAWQTNPVSKD